MSADPLKKRKQELREAIDRLGMLLLVATNPREKKSLELTIQGLKLKLEKL